MQTVAPSSPLFSTTANPSPTDDALDSNYPQHPTLNRDPRDLSPPSWRRSNFPKAPPFYRGGLRGHSPFDDLKPSNIQGVIYGWSVTPPASDASLKEREARIGDYAHRVRWKLKLVEHGSEGERNIKFQDVRQYMEPAGYFSGGLLAAGHDPHEKITVTFTAYTKELNGASHLTSKDERTYFAWEIAAGALKHDRPAGGGVINAQSMQIRPEDRNKINDLESLGAKLQHHWKNEIFKPMVDHSGPLAKRSGIADAYVVRGILQSLRNDKESYKTLGAEGQEALDRTLDKNGNVVIPTIYGYPLSGYAFIPYKNYHGDYDHRPNRGLMIDLKNGKVSKIDGDKEFARWAKENRTDLLRSFNSKDRQGGINTHWPPAGDVLENLIMDKGATYPGRSGKTSDKTVQVEELFNYTQSRTSPYHLKFGSLNSGIAHAYQEMNTKNAESDDQTQVFGSSKQAWKAVKEAWGNTFGYLPFVGNTGNIVFGIHDAVTGMTASDRVGGVSAAVISTLQLAHEAAQIGTEAGLGEAGIRPTTVANESYSWKFNEQSNSFYFERKVKEVEPQTPVESVPERVAPAQGANRVDQQTPTVNGKGTIALKREVGPDGKSVLVPDGIWAERPHILRREKYTDVVVGDKVYRFDPSKPEVLTEVGAASDFELLAGFEMMCGAPDARMRRDLNGLCYTKWIQSGGTPVYQEAQALEHRRLVPSPEVTGQPRTVVHDHRLYQVDPNNGDQLIELPRQSPITYRNQVTGSIVNEPDFGFDELGRSRAINNDTVVVKLGPLSDLSDDQRTLRAYKTQYNGKNYVVAEGDTGVFYFAELNASGQLDFQRITANNNPVSSRMIELHDQYKDIHGYAANGTPNQDIVVLPDMDDLVKNIVIDNNLSPAETQQLKNVLSGLSDEKQRELLLNIRAWGKKLNVPTALKSIALEKINRPATFNSLSPADKNKFFAEASREVIDRQFDATGIRSANQRIPNDLADGARAYSADEIVTWLYTRTAARNYSEAILKVGAGNCDQMAHVAVETINISGGDARIAQVKGHTFTVVGGPMGGQITSGFKGPEWAGAWVVDPWAGISCPASDYPVQFERRMQDWSRSGKQILISDGGTPPQSVWRDPLDPAWINATVHGDAQVFG